MSIDFKAAASLLKTLSWVKLAQLVVLFLVIGVFWFAWQFRQDVYSGLKMRSLTETEHTVIIQLSESTKNKIRIDVEKMPTFIAGIQIVNVNFKKNTRSTSFFYSIDPILNGAVEKYERSSVADTPLFNSNEVNNKRVVSLVNGEYICTPFNDTLAPKIYPSAVGHVTTICSVSIPPHYGKFSGYLNVYLKHEPDANDFYTIRQMANDLSDDIYSVDILQIPQTVPRESIR